MAPPDLTITNAAMPSVHPRVSTVSAGAHTTTSHKTAATRVADGSAGGWVKIDRSKFSFSRQQTAASGLNDVARSIRVADRSMQKIGEQLAHMKKQIQVHLKNFPPYPPGSDARVKLLKSFAAFRRLIDELTMPPDDSDAARIMGGPPEGSADGSALVAEHNGFAKAIERQPVHAGPEGLNIPALGEQADDRALEAVVERLDEAGKILDSRRMGLLADATGVFNPPNL